MCICLLINSDFICIRFMYLCNYVVEVIIDVV